MAKHNEISSLAKQFPRKIKIVKGKVIHPPLDGFIPVREDSIKEKLDLKEDKK